MGSLGKSGGIFYLQELIFNFARPWGARHTGCMRPVCLADNRLALTTHLSCQVWRVVARLAFFRCLWLPKFQCGNLATLSLSTDDLIYFQALPTPCITEKRPYMARVF